MRTLSIPLFHEIAQEIKTTQLPNLKDQAPINQKT